MSDSGKPTSDYARSADRATTAPLDLAESVRAAPRRFRPKWWPTLAAAVLVPLFIAAGQWQWNKARAKTDRQHELEAAVAAPALAMPTTAADPQTLRYRRIVARGHYEPQYQVLIDNRTYCERAGYHVVTPLRIDGSDMRVLVNRGWIPALAEHRLAPAVATPDGTVEISGMAVLPAARFFTLGGENTASGEAWPGVWQNLDLQRFAGMAPFPVQPVVIQLDPESPAGGFVREWPRPDERIQTNLGYAFQWWGFAATTMVLWLALNFRRSP